jgi:hypothetical protein
MFLKILLTIGIGFLVSAILNWICFLTDNKFKLSVICLILGLSIIFIISRFENSYNIASWATIIALVLTGAASRKSERDAKRKKWLGQAMYLVASIISYIIFYGQLIA